MGPTSFWILTLLIQKPSLISKWAKKKLNYLILTKKVILEKFPNDLVKVLTIWVQENRPANQCYHGHEVINLFINAYLSDSLNYRSETNLELRSLGSVQWNPFAPRLESCWNFDQFSLITLWRGAVKVSCNFEKKK